MALASCFTNAWPNVKTDDLAVQNLQSIVDLCACKSMRLDISSDFFSPTSNFSILDSSLLPCGRGSFNVLTPLRS